MIYNQFRQNLYLLLGLVVGLSFSLIFIPYLEDSCYLSSIFVRKFSDNSLNVDEYEPKINLAAKPLKAQRSPQKLLRPRYFSTELGIREKLFVAILTTQQTINTKAVAINKTVSHLVDKLMFFIDAPGSQKLNVSYLKLPGIVGFVDTRLILKPFHVLKYVKDNYIENYDFFFIIKDGSYLKARKLYEVVQRISVSQDVYASTVIKDSLFCSLDAGILFSNSVLQKMLKNIDWCVKNAFSSSDDDNFGRCALHSINNPCQQFVQGNQFASFNLDPIRNFDDTFADVIKMPEFDRSLTVYPVKDATTFYKLHYYFSKVALLSTKLEISALRHTVLNTSHLHPDDYKKVTWPVGNQVGNKPMTRFDVLRWDYFTESHIYLSTDFSNVRPLNSAERLDIKNILNASAEMIESKYDGRLQYRNLISGYRKFDPSRGMDYKLDIVFRDVSTGSFLQKRIEVCKPLGKVEILPVPYVTENRRINIVLPVSVNDREMTSRFLRQYRTVCLEKKDKVFLMLVLMYDYNAPGKGTENDVFKDLKQQALVLTKTFQRDDNRVAWVSIKLPLANQPAVQEALLDFAVLDLALKKFAPDALVLFARPSMDIRMDYLNRVRMNTILGWQIFSPIPFTEYSPSFITDPQCSATLDIRKQCGHYDSLNVDHLSFYVKDYFSTRKQIERQIPLVRADSHIRDIASFFSDLPKNDENVTSLATHTVYSMFVRFGDVHVIRAVEPGLRLHYVQIDCDHHKSIVDSVTSSLYKQCIDKRNFNLGSRSQLAKLILDYKSVVKQPFIM